MAILLRNQPAEISEADFTRIIKEKDFYETSLNPESSGFINSFLMGNIKGARIVIDCASGLMWQQGGSIKPLDSFDAKKYIENLNAKDFAGLRDWRLPTLEEAMSLMKPELAKNIAYTDTVFDSRQKWVWTSDSTKDDRRAWTVYFTCGSCRLSVLSELNYVRAVLSV